MVRGRSRLIWRRTECTLSISGNSLPASAPPPFVQTPQGTIVSDMLQVPVLQNLPVHFSADMRCSNSLRSWYPLPSHGIPPTPPPYCEDVFPLSVCLNAGVQAGEISNSTSPPPVGSEMRTSARGSWRKAVILTTEPQDHRDSSRTFCTERAVS